MLAIQLKVKLATGRNKFSRGFTLLEVMVALVVIALTLSAFIKVSTLQARHLMYLQDKTYALWVAEDVTHELQSGKMAWTANMRDLSGETTMFQKKFEWHILFEPNADNHFSRSEITVNLKGSPTILSRYNAYFSTRPSDESDSVQ